MLTASIVRAGVFLAAFLLFLVQPMVAKRLLAWYGGAPMVWAVSLFFFQTALLAGYGYAHLIASRLPRRGQVFLHAALLLTAVAVFLPPLPGAQWIPDSGSVPAVLILLTLVATIGLPFALLAATTPLISHWLADAPEPGRRVFRWYAVSNAGSLSGLLLHPFVVEPHFRLSEQEAFWSAGFVLVAVLVPVAGLLLPAPGKRVRLRLTAGFDREALALAGFGSFALVAVSTHLTRDLAAAPLLWVAPLALYLVTFILAFSGLPPLPGAWARLLVMASAVACLFLRQRALAVAADPWVLDAALGLVFLFVACQMVHGMAADLRPEPSRVTGFYFSLTAGGAAGGLVAALLAPVVFVNVFEYPLALAGAVAIALSRPPFGWFRKLALGATAGWVVVLTLLEHQRPLHAERTFFGVVRVFEGSQGTTAWRRDLWHGGIAHGSQWMAPDRLREPTLYYYRGTGAELALNRHPKRDRGEPLRVGVVGLGSGALSVWARPGDHFRFHELDPAVEQAAREYFTWLTDSPARTEVVLGDGRLGLAQEHERGDPPWDVLILDAFAGDAIPTHLLTAEAFDLYSRRLGEGGVLAVHISNRHVDLAPVVRAQARRLSWAPLLMVSDGAPDAYHYESTWILLTRNADFLTDAAILGRAGIWVGPAVAPEPHHLWTDDYANLPGVLR